MEGIKDMEMPTNPDVKYPLALVRPQEDDLERHLCSRISFHKKDDNNNNNNNNNNGNTEFVLNPILLSECGQQTVLEFESQDRCVLGLGQRGRQALFSDAGFPLNDPVSLNKKRKFPEDRIESSTMGSAKRKPTLREELLKNHASLEPSLPVPQPSTFRNVHSADETGVQRALDREDTDDLIGDFSRAHCLPVITEGAKHKDLKTIKHSTLVRVLNGEYSDVINSCTIIDGRYPYEYEAGHIRGARNIYSRNQLEEFMTSECYQYLTPTDDGDAPKRNIVIFHCEFSSERGPKLMRLLRNRDRDLHRDSYPSLKFPEIYLLENGYKEFYTEQPAHCQPMHYLPMNHKDYKRDLAYYKAESKMYESKATAHTTQTSTGRRKKRAGLFD